MGSGPGVVVEPATADRWRDLESLFGPNGAYSGCWCMWHRLGGREFDAAATGGGAGTKAMLHELVGSGAEPGLLAYTAGAPVGWCAVAPRGDYGRVLRSPLIRPIEPDEVGVWSITCFFVRRAERGKGVAEALLAAAVEYAAARGARVVEAYAVIPDATRAADLFPGTLGMYQRAGFAEVRRKPPRRVVMRRTL